ncbi:MAG: hypothetical protein P8L98_06865, partial [Planctomycetota bacterium]|nr:hypothetical protein [Planctomycetota bacterium]
MILPFLLTFAALSPASFAQDPFSGAAQKDEAATPTVVVRSIDVSIEEQMTRGLIYSCGSRYILQRTLSELLNDEIARRRAANIFVGDVDILEEDIDAQIQKRIDLVLNQDP